MKRKTGAARERNSFCCRWAQGVWSKADEALDGLGRMAQQPPTALNRKSEKSYFCLVDYSIFSPFLKSVKLLFQKKSLNY